MGGPVLRCLAAGAVAVLLLVAGGPPAAAAEPVSIVHTERVDAGPYALTVGFSEWPLRDGRSFDLLVDPETGIADKSATITVRTPTGEPFLDEEPLDRFPRQRRSWGLDVVAFVGDGSGGRWSLEFTVDGPRGRGTGRLAVLPLEPRPGPPEMFGWALATVPTLLLVGVVGVGWARLRAGRRSVAWSLGA